MYKFILCIADRYHNLYKTNFCILYLNALNKK